MDTFELLESEVRSYCRTWPTVFRRSKGEWLIAEDETEYLDFFAGAGALNYGHNNPVFKEALLRYIMDDGVTHGLDQSTVAKRDFLTTFRDVILRPRGMRYKVQFPGPTGTNAVEAALKLARKVTGRETVVSFTNAFHGMTLGSLSVTGNSFKRNGAGVPLNQGAAFPYDGYLGDETDTLDYLEAFLQDKGSGLDTPAAAIVETVQAEGGLNVASFPWLQRLAAICREHGMLLIVDDIQVGVGRTGPFFSFEPAGLEPDIICLSKSLSGYGLPMAVTLIKPEHDVWEPGEHNGTFRGNNHAFVTAAAALNAYWQDDTLTRAVEAKADTIAKRMTQIIARFPDLELEHRGRGMIQGLKSSMPELAGAVVKEAFQRRLIVETSGPESEVVKILAPLTIEPESLELGLDRFEASVVAARDVLKGSGVLMSV